MLAVVGVTAAVTISVTSGNSGGDDPTPPGETYGLASADDKGPVNIITEDPSCAAWGPIIETFGGIQRKGWNRRDSSVPGSQWTSEQRAQYEEVQKAALVAAQQTVPLARLTPHRVMREFYEQFIAYARAYSESLSNYTPEDESLARVMTNSSAALVYACDAIDFKSAAARSPLIPARTDPVATAPLSDPNDAQRFMRTTDPVCADWEGLLSKLDRETTDWQSLDSAIPASQWTADQRRIIDGTIESFNEFSDQALELAGRTENAVSQDFMIFSAQYRRAYAAALPSYTSADSYLASAGGAAASTVYNACRAAEG
ncbi:hypothetical protein [Mycolicibacterium flavescens]|uniref:hypothetical protein n=1 Tax=Mycolicibacterium flavescens TaxID=1776 RepID=UPI001F279DC1|nr:hypothetical protein [Mycolicibacterium flavescens]